MTVVMVLPSGSIISFNSVLRPFSGVKLAVIQCQIGILYLLPDVGNKHQT